MSDELASGSGPILCSVCDGRGSQKPIVLCAMCADPERVRTYCARCSARTDLSIEEGSRIHGDLLGVKTPIRGGLVIRFLKRCPSCRLEDEPETYPYVIYEINHFSS